MGNIEQKKCAPFVVERHRTHVLPAAPGATAAVHPNGLCRHLGVLVHVDTDACTFHLNVIGRMFCRGCGVPAPLHQNGLLRKRLCLLGPLVPGSGRSRGRPAEYY